MNYDDELRFSKQQQAKLHGAGLGVRADSQADVKPQGLRQDGWCVGKDRISDKPAPAAQYATTGYIAPAPVTPDSELMLQDLDFLVTEVQNLSMKAFEKLNQFADQSAKPISDGALKQVDSRRCTSSYFRLLESRVEMLVEQLNLIDNLLDDVSVSRQAMIGSGSANC